MPRGVKKAQEAEAASENNVTVEGETKEVESTSKSVTVEVQDKTAEEPKKSDESKKSESKKSEKPAEKKSHVKSESKETVEDRFYQIVRPVPIYLAKSIASPVLGISSGKCRIHAFEGPWVKVTMGVAEKGAVTGYIMRSQAIIK
jgi:hypothetical protein